MKKAIAIIALALTATSALCAGWEEWQSIRYGATFESYAVGEQLDSTKGAQGGSWGYPAVPSGSTAVARKIGSDSVYMDCQTGGDSGVAFTPSDAGDRMLKTVTTRVRLSSYEGEPMIPVGARAAFAFCAEGGVATFVGLETTADSSHWVKLYGSMSPRPGGEWYDVSMKFIEKAGVTRVQYRLKNEKGEYEPLHAGSPTGDTWLEAAGTPGRVVASKVEYRGEGGIQNLFGGEPKRGLLIGLVPWRTLLINESVYNQGTGTWAAFDSESGSWMERPVISGDSYEINVADGTDGYAFVPKDKNSDALKVVEFAVRFAEPNDNDAVPEDVSALVRIVEEPLTNLAQVDPVYRFACLVKDGWHTNDTILAELNADYTVEISQNDKTGTVSYRVRRGRGGEGRPYEPLLMDAPMPVFSPFYAFFGGHGLVYEIKSTAKGDNN